MPQPPSERQLTHFGPGGFLKWSISKAEQHIVHAPQDFPNAAVILSLAQPPSSVVMATRSIRIIVPAAARGDFIAGGCLENWRSESPQPTAGTYGAASLGSSRRRLSWTKNTSKAPQTRRRAL